MENESFIYFNILDDFFIEIHDFCEKMLKSANINHYSIDRWRWDIPEQKIQWIIEKLGRNIVIYFNFDKKEIEIEFNAWLDFDDFDKIKNKLYRTRKWTHKIFFLKKLLDDEYLEKISKKTVLEITDHIEKAYDYVSNLSYKDLNNQNIISYRIT